MNDETLDETELYDDLGVTLDGTETSEYGGIREAQFHLHRCRSCGVLVADADWDSSGTDTHTEWHKELGR